MPAAAGSANGSGWVRLFFHPALSARIFSPPEEFARATPPWRPKNASGRMKVQRHPGYYATNPAITAAESSQSRYGAAHVSSHGCHRMIERPFVADVACRGYRAERGKAEQSRRPYDYALAADPVGQNAVRREALSPLRTCPGWSLKFSQNNGCPVRLPTQFPAPRLADRLCRGTTVLSITVSL